MCSQVGSSVQTSGRYSARSVACGPGHRRRSGISPPSCYQPCPPCRIPAAPPPAESPCLGKPVLSITTTPSGFSKCSAAKVYRCTVGPGPRPPTRWHGPASARHRRPSRPAASHPPRIAWYEHRTDVVLYFLFHVGFPATGPMGPPARPAQVHKQVPGESCRAHCAFQRIPDLGTARIQAVPDAPVGGPRFDRLPTVGMEVAIPLSCQMPRSAVPGFHLWLRSGACLVM